MPQLSKQALVVANNQSFPNNNAGEITPAVLRTYNTDVIESTVNQTEYTANSGSWNTTLQSINSKTGSYATTGSNSFIGNQLITGNVSASFFYGDGSGLTGVTAGENASVNAFTASQLNINSGYNAFTSSANAKFQTIGSQSGSWVTESETGSFATTGSNTFNGNQTINGYINVGGGVGVSGSQTIGTSTGSINLNVGSGSINLTVATGSQSIIFLNSYLTQNKGRFSVSGPEFNVKTSDDSLVKLSLDTTGGEYTPLNLYGQYAYDTVNVNSANTGSAPFAGHTIDDSANSNNNIGFFGAYIDGATQATYGVLFVGGGQTNNAANDGIIFRSFGNNNRVDFLKNVTITGSLGITGSATINRSAIVTANQTGSLVNTALNAFTASQNSKNSTLATYTGSNDTKWNTLGNLTGSFATTGSNSFVGKQTITNAGGIAIQLTGSLQLTGSNSNTINGQTTINVAGGNGLTINGGGLLSQGSISGFGGLGLYSTDASITLAKNSNNSGSAYSGITVYVDNTTDPTNVFSTINFLDADTYAGMGIGWNSYTGYYPTSVPMIFANQQYNGNDVAIAFPTNVIDLWKPTNVKSGLVVTGSVKQNVVPVTIASSTASLDLSAGTYFTLTLANNATTHIKPINLAAGVSATVVITTGTNSSASLSPIMLQPSGLQYTASLGSSKVDILSLVSTNTSNTYVVSTKNLV